MFYLHKHTELAKKWQTFEHLTFTLSHNECLTEDVGLPLRGADSDVII